ncbi:hypothetical protein LCGC14_2701570 [marine sediment metagenome]|uniref:Uncharacterized protein n=1 Tax=marine sediment metagenome TaxID=412755 RepID=A0A0F9A373_9ZZZZ
MSIDDEELRYIKANQAGDRLRELARLAQFFRAHPHMSWGEFCTKAISGGYSEGEADLIWWFSGIEYINRAEEDYLAKQAQRN